jgi:hypothetical protein
MDPLVEMTRLTSAYMEASTDERQLNDQSAYHDEEEFSPQQLVRPMKRK